MSTLAKNTWQQLARLDYQQGVAVPSAFGQDIFLISTSIAGVGYYEGINDLEGLESDSPLQLQRDPMNQHDSLAIKVSSASGQQIGHIPRIDNAILARLMDAGKQLSAKLEAVKQRDHWTQVGIRVYMQNL